MLKMLAHKIDDRRFLRLIQKWLKAGVLTEDGEVRQSETGCPQGGVISPILANIYLHYVLDLWFEKEARGRYGDHTVMSRYADDEVFAFRYLKQARAFFAELPKRLAKFGLELSLEKTRIVRFNRYQTGKRRSETFEYLGFQYRWIVDRNGTPRVRRRTAPSRFSALLQRVREWCRTTRSKKTREIFAILSRKLLGYYQYYGVLNNSQMLWAFFNEVTRALKKWLARRSQKGRMSWKRFNAMVEYHGLERPRITQSKVFQLPLATCRLRRRERLKSPVR